jgi:hypothetical protein
VGSLVGPPALGHPWTAASSRRPLWDKQPPKVLLRYYDRHPACVLCAPATGREDISFPHAARGQAPSLSSHAMATASILQHWSSERPTHKGRERPLQARLPLASFALRDGRCLTRLARCRFRRPCSISETADTVTSLQPGALTDQGYTRRRSGAQKALSSLVTLAMSVWIALGQARSSSARAPQCPTQLC